MGSSCLSTHLYLNLDPKEFQVKLDFLEIFRLWFPSLAQLCHAAPDRARRANIQYVFSPENLNSLNPGELFLFDGTL